MLNTYQWTWKAQIFKEKRKKKIEKRNIKGIVPCSQVMGLKTKMRHEDWDCGSFLNAAPNTYKQIVYCYDRSSYSYQQNTLHYKKHKALTFKFKTLSNNVLWKPKLKNRGTDSSRKFLLTRCSLGKRALL